MHPHPFHLLQTARACVQGTGGENFRAVDSGEFHTSLVVDLREDLERRPLVGDMKQLSFSLSMCVCENVCVEK